MSLTPQEYGSDGDEEANIALGSPLESYDIPIDPPDISPLLTELGPDDFPSYFIERDGRLFHSHGNSPYPLPADTAEQQRLNVQHNVLYRLIGAHYVGPVRDILAPEPGRQKMTLDLCTGTGKWVMDMAQEFPHVHFRGIDIVPIATRYPPQNVQFEVHDVNTQYRWGAGMFDLVHARSVSMAVRDYPAVLREVARVLRPGGLFLSCEWGRGPAFDPSYPSSPIPGLCHFFEVLTKALDVCRGIQPIASVVPSFINHSGLFTEITTYRYYVPIGPWHWDERMRRLGRAFRAAHLRYADSVKPLLTEAGWTEGEITDIVDEFIHELKTVRGLVSVYHVAHARRR